MTAPINYEQQIKNIQSSPKFSGQKPVNFPGYTIITPPHGESNHNQEFYKKLAHTQRQLVEGLGADFFVALPADSFHITLADLIWDDIYLNAVKDKPNFDQLLISKIENIFKDYKTVYKESKPFEFDVLGISIFPRAIAVCLAPTEKFYESIIKLRQLIYQDEEIVDLGIEQNYEFAAHVTLGYFGDVSDDFDYHKVQSVVTEINDQWLENSPSNFIVEQFELRKFTDMTNFIRQDDWAMMKLY
ncbi:DUF1868 domain-containing protein [Cyanobacterium stanieri]|nr:DUF1868 domain-containing protein [Cyanobacterium stanieri]